MSLKRPLVLTLGITMMLGAVASLLVRFAWRNEPWANYTRFALFVLCMSSLILMYRLGLPIFAAFRQPSPNWRRITVGALVIVAMLPWSFFVGLAVRYGLLPDNVIGGLVLLIPLAAFLVTGLYMLIRGAFWP